MINKVKESIKEGYFFQGAWLSYYSSPKEKQIFKEKRDELKKQGYKIRTLIHDEGKGLFVKKRVDEE